VASDTFLNASGNLNILSTNSVLIKFDSDGNQTDREFNIQSNSSTQLFKIDENGAMTHNGTASFAGAITIPDKIIHAGDTNTFFSFNAADQIQLVTGGVERVAFYNSETHFNDGGTDVDFIVESNGNANMLFVDGNENRVGVGLSAPLEPLHTQGRILSTTSYGSATQQIGTSIGQNAAVNATVDFRRWTGGGTNHGVGAIEVDASGVMHFYADSKTSNTPATTKRISLAPSGAFTTTPTTAGHAVFNGNGVNADFQVLSDGNSHMLFVDGGENRIGIGKSSPSHVLDVANPDASVSTVTAAFRAGGDNNDNRSNLFIGQQGNSRGLILRAGRETGDRAISQFILNGSGGTIGSNIINALEFYENGSGLYTTTFNQDGENVDFRVASDAKSHALFLDASTNILHLGGSTQAASTSFLNCGGVTFSNGAAPTNHFFSWDNEGAEAAQQLVAYYFDGAYRNRMSIGGNNGETSVNASGLNVDFRVASDSNANMLFVDGGNNKVGIGTNSPATHLQVEGASGAELGLHRTAGTTTGLLGSITVGNKDVDSGMGGIDFTQDGATNSSRIGFFTQPTGGAKIERLRIESGGLARISVGVTVGRDTNLGSAIATIQSNNAQGLAIGYGTGTNEFRKLYHHVSGLYFQSSTNQAYLSASGAWTNASDVTLKKDIEDIDYGIETVKSLKPRKYKMKSDNEAQIGFIAQELVGQVPEIVGGKDGLLGVSYGQLTAVLTKAIQEQQTLIESLTARIAALEE